MLLLLRTYVANTKQFLLEDKQARKEVYTTSMRISKSLPSFYPLATKLFMLASTILFLWLHVRSTIKLI